MYQLVGHVAAEITDDRLPGVTLFTQVRAGVSRNIQDLLDRCRSAGIGLESVCLDCPAFPRISPVIALPLLPCLFRVDHLHELALQDLPYRAPGQILHEDDLAGNLELRELSRQVFHELIIGK